MKGTRVVLLDGTAASSEPQQRVAGTLHEVLERTFDEVQTFVLRDERLAHCIGCFGCWLETPGLCRSADCGRDMVRELLYADTVVLLTPVTFGGYSSTLKRLVDRWVQVLLPFFRKMGGELHHPLRYDRFPRLVAVGIQSTPDEAEATLFRCLVARNAINFHSPSSAAEVVREDDGHERIREKLVDVLSRSDPQPDVAALRALVPEPSETPVEGGRRALVIVGSPKVGTPSTSGVLGRQLLGGLVERGWEGETRTIRGAIRYEAWRMRMIEAVEAADLVVLAFPLYIDAVPALVTRALEVMHDHFVAERPARPRRLVAIVNSGFPEAHQSLPAVAICERFAASSGMTWAGGLVMGSGEALSSGRPLKGRTGAMAGPPVGHVIAALDRAAAELAAGRPVPRDATTTIARTPIPFLPFAAWRRLFALTGGRHWRSRAAANGVAAADLYARPFM